MPKRTHSFANQVRKVLIARGEVSAIEICEVLDLLGTAMRKPVYKSLQDFVKSGEVERIRPGVYRYIRKPKKPEYREIMWRVLRARRTVTVDDLVEMSGAGRRYARQWLSRLVRREVVRRFKSGRYQLIKDQVEMPENDDKAAYLRDLRKNKKDALEKLDTAWLAIKEARMAVAGIKGD